MFPAPGKRHHRFKLRQLLGQTQHFLAKLMQRFIDSIQTVNGLADQLSRTFASGLEANVSFARP